MSIYHYTVDITAQYYNYCNWSQIFVSFFWVIYYVNTGCDIVHMHAWTQGKVNVGSPAPGWFKHHLVHTPPICRCSLSVYGLPRCCPMGYTFTTLSQTVTSIPVHTCTHIYIYIHRCLHGNSTHHKLLSAVLSINCHYCFLPPVQSPSITYTQLIETPLLYGP